MDTAAERIEVRVPSDQVFEVRLTGLQLRYLLNIVGEHVFPGSKAFFVAELINALQEPIIAGSDREGSESNRDKVTKNGEG